MTSIDFVIVDDKPEKYGVLTSSRIIELAEILAEVSVQLQFAPESRLRYPWHQSFPQGAIVYVHGNFNQGYINTTYVRKLAPQRPDLKFILALEGARYSEDRFRDPDDYGLVRRVLDTPPHASEQVLVNFDIDFFTAPHPDDKTTYWMVTYLQQLKQLRGL